jgi:hypothetical protein
MFGAANSPNRALTIIWCQCTPRNLAPWFSVRKGRVGAELGPFLLKTIASDFLRRARGPTRPQLGPNSAPTRPFLTENHRVSLIYAHVAKMQRNRSPCLHFRSSFAMTRNPFSLPFLPNIDRKTEHSLMEINFLNAAPIGKIVGTIADRATAVRLVRNRTWPHGSTVGQGGLQTVHRRTRVAVPRQ